jgi:hypothetical protein
MPFGRSEEIANLHMKTSMSSQIKFYEMPVHYGIMSSNKSMQDGGIDGKEVYSYGSKEQA